MDDFKWSVEYSSNLERELFTAINQGDVEEVSRLIKKGKYFLKIIQLSDAFFFHLPRVIVSRGLAGGFSRDDLNTHRFENCNFIY